MAMYHRLKALTVTYPILRGMISYSVVWPIGNLMEQSLMEKRNIRTYDYGKCMRVSLHGALFMGPTMFVWLRLASAMFPGRSFGVSISKAFTEQMTYDPICIVAFLYAMTVTEGRSHEEARKEVADKFWNTFCVGAVYWPTVQTFNFTFIPVRNQVVFTSLCSMFWSGFLAWMRQTDDPEDANNETQAERYEKFSH